MAEISHPEASAEGLSQANITPDEARLPAGRQVYEIGFHVVPTIPEAAVAGIVDKIRAELGKSGAEIIKEQFPQKMTLAYTIERAAQGKREKYGEAYFGFIKCAADKEAVPALHQWLSATKEILRYLLVETVREDVQAVRRAIFTSNRLEGEVLQKPVAVEEKGGEISEEELDKSIDALVN